MRWLVILEGSYLARGEGATLSHGRGAVVVGSMMWPRLELLRDLLAEDGSIWVSIDDSEGAYMKVILDEVFGRSRFVATNVWQKRYSRENREAIGDVHEYIYVYAVNPEGFKRQRNRIPLTEDQAKIYKNPNSDPKGRWRGIPMTAQGFRLQNKLSNARARSWRPVGPLTGADA